MASTKEKHGSPPVISHISFTSFLNMLRDADAVPARIDKTLMPKASGSQQAGTLSALRFLGLIDDAGKPGERFKSLVLASDEERKQPLQEILRSSYAFLFSDPDFDLSHASSGQMTEKFRELGIGGSTLTKTISFFLSAAKEYGIHVSPHIKPPQPPKSNSSPRRTKAAEDDKGDGKPSEKSPEDADNDDPGLERFEIPMPGKRSVKISVPSGLDADDWAMLQTMLAAYIKRWKGFPNEEK